MESRVQAAKGVLIPGALNPEQCNPIATNRADRS